MKRISIFFLVLFFMNSSSSLYAQNISPAGTPNGSNNGDLYACDSAILHVTGLKANQTIQWQTQGNSISGANGDTLIVKNDGTYGVILTDTSIKSGPNTTFLNTVTVFLSSIRPIASFTPTSGSSCGSSNVTFVNNSSITPSDNLSYVWSFGDGKFSTNISPQHKYKASRGNGNQSYNVVLTTTSSYGCSASNTVIYTLGQGPDPTLNGPGATTLNGKPYFKICAANGQTFTFTNGSTTTNTDYIIRWGDGTPDFTSTTFSSITHNYSVGTKQLTFIVSNGSCTDSSIYNVFVGNIPQGGISGVGGSTICVNNQQDFLLTNILGNTSGTSYYLSYNDGSVTDTFLNPIDTVSHIFKISSCGHNSSNGSSTFPNSFAAFLTITNPCGVASGSILPIYVSDRPITGFTLSKDTICQNQTITLTNTSIAGNNVDNGNCTPGKIVYKISSSTPGASWTVVSGTLGDDFLNADPNLWTPASLLLQITFNTPGTYIIKQIIANNTLCGSDTLIKTICVNPLPTASFVLDNNNICAASTITATGSTNIPNCSTNTFNWTVVFTAINNCAPGSASYSFVNGTTPNSQNPQIQFNTPGNYTLILVTTAPGGSCSSVAYSLPITVNDKPNISVAAISNFCNNGSITPIATATCNVLSATYAWDLTGGIPSSASTLNPGSVTYNTAGNYSISFSATNNCGVSTITKNFTVTPLPSPFNVTGGGAYCNGSSGLPVGLASSESGVNYQLYKDGVASGNPIAGNGSAISFGNKTAAGVYTIIATNASTSCVYNMQGSVTITILTLPTILIVNPPAVCSPATVDITLPAITSGSTPGLSFTYWTTNAAVTNVSTPSAVNTSGTYYIKGTDGNFCAFVQPVVVTINPLPISYNVTGGGSYCANLAGLTVGLNNSETGNTYQLYLDGVAIGSPKNGTGAALDFGIQSAAGTYTIQATNTLSSCSNSMTGSASISILSLPSLVITNSAGVCFPGTVDITSASVTTGSSSGLTFSYWTSANASGSIANPGAIGSSGSYYIKATNSNSCSVIQPVAVTIHPLPVVAAISGAAVFCEGSSTVFTDATANGIWASGTSSVATIDVNGQISGISAGSSTISYSVTDANNCQTVVTKLVNVSGLVTPTISISASANTICNGSTVLFSASTTNAGSAPIYQWYKNGISVGANSATYSDASLINSDVLSCILTANSCASNPIANSNLITITVNPIPQIISTVPGSVCGTGVVSLAATASIGTINWYSTLTGGSSINSGTNFNTASLSNTTNYFVDATSNGCTTFNRTLITATINPLPVASVIADKTICNGTSINIGNTAIVGNSYAWSSTPAGYTSAAANPSVSPSINTNYTLIETVNVTGCTNSHALNISINPIPDVNVNPASLSICSNTVASITLTGSVPNTIFNWTIIPNTFITGAQNGTGTFINQTLVNANTSPQQMSYVVTPSYTNNSVTCTGTPVTSVFTINPSPQVNFSRPNEVICSGSNSSVVNLSTLTSGATISWTSTNPSGISGIVSSGTTTIPSQTLVNTSNVPITIVYTAVATTTSGPSCTGANNTYLITVNPTPNVTATPNTQIICSNSSINITLSTTVPGTVFNWVVSSNANITGAVNGTGAGIIQNLVNSSTIPQQITYTLTPAFINGGITCQGSPVNVLITVNPSPVLIGALLQSSICTQNLFIYSPTSLTPTTIFNWTRPAIVGISNPAILNGSNGISETLINTTVDPIAVKYFYTLTANGCSNPQTIVDTVYPNAKAIFTADTLISCSPYVLKNHITLISFPNANDETNYNWYANNNSIGTGTTIPNYSIINSSDTIILKLFAKSKYGCSNDSMLKTIYTIEQPKPSFIMSTHKGCGPLTLNFTNTTSPINAINNSKYLWDFGNGITSVLTNPPSIIFNASPKFKDTTYYITLTVSTSCNTYTYNDSLTVRPSPKALLSTGNIVGCSPFPVNLQNNSLGADKLGNGNTYYWSFGDGFYDTTNTLSTVKHIYHNGSQKIDTSIIRLIVQNECGIDSIKYNVVIFPNTVKPALMVNGSEKYGCAPHTVNFFNNSSGANRFNWDFNDQTVFATTKSPDTVMHVFTGPGTFVVTMMASNGCSDTAVTDTIVVYPAMPVPKYNFKLISCFGDSVQFVNNTDTGLASGFIWNLGDGSSSNSFQVAHLYKNLGSYVTSLKAFKIYNTGVTCSNIDSSTLQVIAKPVTIFTSNNFVLNCSPFNLIVNTNPIFGGSAEWKFTDPYSSDTLGNGFNSSHIFNKGGNFKVQLKLTNAGGCIDSISQPIKVTETPKADFSFGDSIFCTRGSAAQDINFNNTTSFGSSNIVTYEWRVNGVLYSNSPTQFSYHFTAIASDNLPKVYSVSLRATSSSGCSNEKIRQVSFVPFPKPNFVLPKNQICGNSLLLANDIDNTVLHTRKWSWNTNDVTFPSLTIDNDTASSISISIPQNSITKDLVYTLKLIEISNYGCVDSVTQIIRVFPQPKIDFQLQDSICSKVDYTLVNISDPYNSGTINNMKFNWYFRKYQSFGDTVLINYSTDLNPNFNVTNSGIKDSIYLITLLGKTVNGCVDSVMHKIIVHPSTVALYTSTPAISCAPLTLTVLTNQSLNVDKYNWYLNDTLYSNLKIPLDTILTKSGKRFNLKLVTSNKYGCLSDSLTQMIKSYISPVSKFVASKDSSCTGNLLVHLFNQSTASGTNLNNWYWDFGDGSTSLLQNPDHQYNVPGKYVISLQIQDGRQCFSDSPQLKTVTIFGKPRASFIANNVCLGDSILFFNQSTLGFGSNRFVQSLWNFGDGKSGLDFSPSHFYANEGTYPVMLVMSSDMSCIPDTTIHSITVYGKPHADFSWDVSCANEPINLTNLSTPGFGEKSFGSTLWTINNGFNSGLNNPHIQISTPGIYNIKLLVSDAICTNLMDTISKNINVVQARMGQVYPRIEAVYGTPVTLRALNGGVSYSWVPVIGLNASNVQNPEATYRLSDPNRIMYTINIIDSAGCPIKDNQEVFVFNKPSIIAPTAFVLNGNDISNRRFLPHYININRLVSLKIFDRWGVEHFSTSDMSQAWNGRDRKGNILPLETYVWIAIGIDNNGNQVIGKGNVTLIPNQ